MRNIDIGRAIGVTLSCATFSIGFANQHAINWEDPNSKHPNRALDWAVVLGWTSPIKSGKTAQNPTVTIIRNQSWLSKTLCPCFSEALERSTAPPSFRTPPKWSRNLSKNVFKIKLKSNLDLSSIVLPKQWKKIKIRSKSKQNRDKNMKHPKLKKAYFKVEIRGQGNSGL